jgi:hypothetical protein
MGRIPAFDTKPEFGGVRDIPFGLASALASGIGPRDRIGVPAGWRIVSGSLPGERGLLGCTISGVVDGMSVRPKASRIELGT